MVLKQLLGEIMAEMGFVTRDQVEEALHRQRQIMEERRMLPNRVQRAGVISEAPHIAERTPLLGEILTDMQLATKEQLDAALREQEKMVARYQSLGGRRLGLAIESAFMLNSTLNLPEVLALIMRHANRVTPSAASTVMLLDEKTGELVSAVPAGPEAERLSDIRLPSGSGIAGWVAKYEQPALVPNVKEEPRFNSEIDGIRGIEPKSILCVPLKASTKLIGVLEVMNKVDGSTFTEEDALMLTILGSQAAIAIENARLYGELNDRLDEEIMMKGKIGKYEKFRALALMASGVAHDFNNLLMAIQGNISLLLLGMNKSHAHYKRLRKIEDAIQSGANLTKQLLGFARGGAYDTKTANLNELIERSSEMFGRTKRDIKIHRKYQEDIWGVNVDQGQIDQALVSLYNNASHAMPAGGDLYLQTENVTLDEECVKRYDIKPGNYVRISVTDTGPEMDKETRERIFDPFFSTRKMGRGTGLGLASTYGIIRNHGGVIGVNSEKGKGTTFSVILPAGEKEIAMEKDRPEKILGGAETILFVDDEELVLDVGRQILEKMGYKVLLAKSGKEALGVYDQNRDRIDMVILDMVMPDMGGVEAYDRLKEIDSEVKVLLSSGYSIHGQASEIMERGCDGFVQKPFKMSQLSQKIREILDRE